MCAIYQQVNAPIKRNSVLSGPWNRVPSGIDVCIAKALFSKNHQVFGDVMDRVRQKIDKRIGQWDQFVKKVYGDWKNNFFQFLNTCVFKW